MKLRALTAVDLLRAGIPERYWKASFKDVLERAPNAPYIPFVRNYLKGLDGFVKDGAGLYLWSEKNGTGKTGLACVMGKRALMMGFSVLFIRSQALKDATVEGSMFSENETLAFRARTVDLTIVDDFGKEYKTNSGYAETVIEDFVRERVQRGKAILMTSNLHPDDVSSTFSVDLKEVMKEAMVPVKIVGPEAGGINWRDLKKEELKAALLRGEA